MRERIEEALAEARVVAIDREVFDEEGELGFVIEVGEELFVLLQISDGLRFNGVSVLRIADVSDVELPHEHADFVESALRMRGESVEVAPDIDLDSWETAIRTAGRQSELVTIHTEVAEPGICRASPLAAARPSPPSAAG